jgi:GTP cyclohydrolase IIa
LVYTVVIRLVNYREWIESLGFDREWVVQVVQSRIYSDIQSYVKDFNGFTLPLRYDVQVAILPCTTRINDVVKGLEELLMRYPQINVRVDSYCGLPHEVLTNGPNVGGCNSTEVCVAHIDLNNFTLRSVSEGYYKPYVEVLNMVSTLARKFMGKAVLQYLGGDNVVVVTSPNYLDEVIKESVDGDVKVGVGISEIPRKAFELAAKALSILRSEGRNSKYLVLRV